MELHEIRYFLAVSDTLNFTRAAERCNVTQPSLTRAIQSLEAKVGGGPLINRERGNTHLTELGRLMLPYFLDMLSSMEAAIATARDFVDTAAGTVKLGLMCTIGPIKMAALFEELYRSNPQIRLMLKDGTAPQLQDMLARGELDAAIYCRPEALDDRFHILPLYQERFVIAFPPNHPWHNQQEIRFKDLHGQPYLNRINCEYNEHIDRIQAMVMAGLGCTSIPEYAIALPNMPWRPLVDPSVVRTVNLVTVRGRPHGAAIGALVHAVKRHKWSPVDEPVA